MNIQAHLLTDELFNHYKVYTAQEKENLWGIHIDFTMAKLYSIHICR